MTSIPNIEPQACGLIELRTTFGNLEVELFTQQCPKATKNFVQLCLDGYYNGSIFNRIEKDFIAIGGVLGDESGDINKPSETFPDEFHSRLRFSRRGLLATANTEKDANGTEFFFTLGPAPELQNKHTIFGRLKGNSVYHLVDLNDCQVDEDQKPLSEKKIIDVVVVDNPYPELTPRDEYSHSRRQKQSTTKEVYDPLNRPQTSSLASKKLSFFQQSDDEEEDDEDEEETSTSKQSAPQQTTNPEKNDLNPKPEKKSELSNHGEASMRDNSDITRQNNDEEKDDRITTPGEREKRLREIREQIQELKKQFDNESKSEPKRLSDRRLQKDINSQTGLEVELPNVSGSSSDQTEMDSSRESRLASKKGRHREREAIESIQNFKKKLKESSKGRHEVQQQQHPALKKDYNDELGDELAALDKLDDDAWLHHRFEAPVDESPMAKDANTKSDDWYPIEDPRNPMIKRIESDRSREHHKSSHRDDRRREDKNNDHRNRSRRHHH